MPVRNRLIADGLRIEEGLDTHFASHINSVMWTLPNGHDELKNIEWKMTPYRCKNLASFVQKSTKRSREADEDPEENHCKRLYGSAQQPIGGNPQGNQEVLGTDARNAIFRRYDFYRTLLNQNAHESNSGKGLVTTSRAIQDSSHGIILRCL